MRELGRGPGPLAGVDPRQHQGASLLRHHHGQEGGVATQESAARRATRHPVDDGPTDDDVDGGRPDADLLLRPDVTTLPAKGVKITAQETLRQLSPPAFFHSKHILFLSCHRFYFIPYPAF